ncbi:MAG: tRNA adenosine(34) deaminase TadA [Planctomycetes bacterium]|nr:tRNA adenosine(34) deaminase TadA [Planctomycetota bacterium]
MLERDHNFYMQEVLKESAKALEKGEVPVGAVAVHQGRIIARAHNQKELLKDPTAHAEMIAITQAASAVDNWRLREVDFYVTIEPCLMCAGALVQARVRRIIFGATDIKAGGCGSIFNLVNDSRLNHQIEIVSGIMESECRAILREFFQTKRFSNTEN